VSALWSEPDPGSSATSPDSVLAMWLHAIDLRRRRPYHAATATAPRRSGAAPSSRPSLRAGLWISESDGMREYAVARLKGWIRFILHTDDTPRRAALAFALGVFIACTPTLGLHTVLALSLAFLFGLNRVAILAGTFVNNPWTVVPIYSGSAMLGSVMLGSPLPPPSFVGVSSLADLGEFLGQFRPWLGPLTAGALVLGLVGSILSFPIVLYGIRWYRALRRTG
jgi:uncharacterized protein